MFDSLLHKYILFETQRMQCMLKVVMCGWQDFVNHLHILQLLHRITSCELSTLYYTLIMHQLFQK